jgi:riboflavin biosynthesis pyrimidine reductase
MLRQLDTGEPVTDLMGLVVGEDRPAGDQPWMMFNMVTSIDGATTVSGGSTGLSDDDDRSLFHALRAVPDYILVGAGTARAENYRPVSVSESALAARSALGKNRIPRLVIVTGRLSLEPDARMFGDPSNPVLILGLSGADGAKVEALQAVAEVRLLDSLDGASIIEQLEGVILCEGGPQLNGEVAGSGLVQEVNWTVSPMIVSGESKRMVAGPAVEVPVEMRLARALQGDRSIFLRYVRA